MKIINLNESQFTRLFDEGIENYGRSNTPEYQNQDEVTLTAKKINQDGDIEDSKPINTNKFSRQQTPQQWGSVGGRKSSNTI
jgi:hypothetical protein